MNERLLKALVAIELEPFTTTRKFEHLLVISVESGPDLKLYREVRLERLSAGAMIILAI